MEKAKRRSMPLIGLLLTGALLLAGCGGESAAPKAEESGAGGTGGAAVEQKALKVRFYDDPAGFDPASIFRIENENIAFNIFSGLTTYDSQTGKIIPDLAEKWESPDNKTWTFHLRKGVQWQGGLGEFKAKDVVYSYKRILDPKTASPYQAEFNNVASIESPDDYTVVITLKKPDGNFLHQVANYHQGQIVKQEAVEKYGDQFKWHPVGTGPYALESIDPNSHIVLTRNEGYYGGPAPIPRIDFSIIKDDQTATIALQNGEVDLAMRISRQESLDQLEAAGFKMNHVDNYAASLKVFNLSNKYLKDIRVRQAYAYAVDYGSIVNSISPKLQAPANSLLMDWMDGYTEDTVHYKYDPEKAKALMKESGYDSGITIKQLTTSATGVTDTMQLEKEYLSKVGINLEFDLVDTPTFNKRRNDGDFDTTSRLLPAVNPDTLLFSFFHPDNLAPKGLNGARYDNKDLTSKLESARAEVDKGKRTELYKEVQQIAMKDVPYLPQYTSNVYWPGKKEIGGVVINKLAQVNFRDVSWTK
ncbi:ABC transporter substrate-binding protein [Paenibacillus thalictri]|uniref:ABC transporter substrate-binding protein n=1 Tax=Paenibacillus thalictri TaxID=2527873 RepID=A0A4Q9DZF4_9BACL|nr:ABC transporter substrate-binding protein [Paenibacillus thalictri]TBL81520.1 ABC transporter substrate-binding protein [Paenibacillus thalictri]